MSSPFRHSSPLPNLLAIAYAFAGWAIGVWLITQPEWTLNAVGLLLTAHALVYSADLIHECAHSAVFASTVANDRLACCSAA